MLPLTSVLRSFVLIHSTTEKNKILFAFLMSNLLTLQFIHEVSLIIYLTVSDCFMNSLLNKLFKYILMLIYLNADHVAECDGLMKNNIFNVKCNTIH
jgi:hypothetical protein